MHSCEAFLWSTVLLAAPLLTGRKNSETPPRWSLSRSSPSRSPSSTARTLPRRTVAVVLVVLVCGGCAYYQNAKKKKAVEVGLDADSLEFKGVGP